MRPEQDGFPVAHAMVNSYSIDADTRQPPRAGLRSGSPRPLKLKLLRWLPEAWILTAGDRSRRSLYLTFDDGPNPDHTPRLLDLLAQHDAKATFFVVGRQAQMQQELLQRMLADGHQLGNHSWTHENFARIPIARQREEIELTDLLLTQIDSQPLHSFRPPRGILSLGLLMDCHRRRRHIAYWSYDTRDYSRRPISELVALARRHPVRPGDIVLMHDDSEHSLGLLAAMLLQWKNEGYAFEPLPACGMAAPQAVLAVEGGSATL